MFTASNRLIHQAEQQTVQILQKQQKQPKQLNNKKVRYHFLYLGDNGLFNL